MQTRTVVLWIAFFCGPIFASVCIFLQRMCLGFLMFVILSHCFKHFCLAIVFCRVVKFIAGCVCM